jgi:hypothetical protein
MAHFARKARVPLPRSDSREASDESRTAFSKSRRGWSKSAASASREPVELALFDVRFVVGPERELVEASRVALAARSPVFAIMCVTPCACARAEEPWR